MQRSGSKDEAMGAQIAAAIAAGKPLELRGLDLPANASAVRVEVWKRYDVERDTDRVRIEISYEAKS